MPESRPEIIALLRTHFGEEAANGFPRLKIIPQTKVIQFLDYYAALDRKDQDALLDALAVRGETYFAPGRDRQFPPAPAFNRYWQAITTPGPFFGGYRYIDVKMLSGLARCKEEGGLEGIMKNVTGLARQPRPDLLPDLCYLIPAKAPLLRKLFDAALKRGGFTKDKTKQGPELKYDHPSGTSVRLDFGSYMGQVRYEVGIPLNQKVLRLGYELLWGQPGGWDYLTEENAERLVDKLPGLIEHMVNLVGKVAAIRG